jgi:hypothetical protein
VSAALLPQAVANMLGALAMLHMAPMFSLRDALWPAAKREAPNLNPQEVASSVWALTTRNMPPACILRDVLWAAPEREAYSVNPEGSIGVKGHACIFQYNQFWCNIDDSTTGERIGSSVRIRKTVEYFYTCPGVGSARI